MGAIVWRNLLPRYLSYILLLYILEQLAAIVFMSNSAQQMVAADSSETTDHIYKKKAIPPKRPNVILDVCTGCIIYFREMERVLRTVCIMHSGSVYDDVVSE
jgi:hypothetical protein